MYGYLSADDDEDLKSLYQVSLCFRGPDDIQSFADQLQIWAQHARKTDNWDHEHYFTDGTSGESVIIAIDTKAERNSG